ncbi:MAG: DHH family phosphoesterase [Candidatus Anstonellales archaeon]
MTKTSEGLGKKIKDTANALLEASRSGAFALIRYHNDADGICAALSIGKIFFNPPPLFIPSHSATYSLEEAEDDAEILLKKEKPLCILLDFGVNDESVRAIGRLKDEGIEVLIIDHHPISNRLQHVDFLVSPLLYSLSSDYTTGFLCAQIAKYAGISDKSVDMYGRVSIAGDKSELIKVGEKERKAAMILEFVSSSSEFPKNVQYYERVLEDKELFDSLWLCAKDKFEKILEGSRTCTRVVEKEKWKLYYINVDKLTKREHFPSKAKALTVIFDAICEVESKKAVIVVGWGDALIVFRANREAIEAGFDSIKVIEMVKAEIGNAIRSGGGHRAAASIRTKRGFGPIILREIERMI